ncbi:ribonuclease HII [Patescibacteria group bacterium]|nr:ribonuclease HII [Patescibacteria group bacterium]
MYQEEQTLRQKGFQLIAGVDEAGRGPLAGPVVAAAVVFPQNYNPDFGIFDSKLLLPKYREIIAGKVKRVAKIGLGEISVKVINKIGIGKASQKAFRAALMNLPLVPQFYLIDAFYIQYWARENQLPIKKGDRICASIAAASIVAKVYRDNLMKDLDKKYPGYGFAIHKGYGTKSHQFALKKHSFSPIHRKSFNLDPYVATV